MQLEHSILTAVVLLLLAFNGLFAQVLSPSSGDLPRKKEILEPLRLVNGYFMKKWPDPGKSIVTNKERPSNFWTRGV